MTSVCGYSEIPNNRIEKSKDVLNTHRYNKIF
nr:MAG TPA: Type II secretion pathway protein [Caudoviricetes sp.]